MRMRALNGTGIVDSKMPVILSLANPEFRLVVATPNFFLGVGRVHPSMCPD